MVDFVSERSGGGRRQVAIIVRKDSTELSPSIFINSEKQD